MCCCEHPACTDNRTATVVVFLSSCSLIRPFWMNKKLSTHRNVGRCRSEQRLQGIRFHCRHYERIELRYLPRMVSLKSTFSTDHLQLIFVVHILSLSLTLATGLVDSVATATRLPHALQTPMRTAMKRRERMIVEVICDCSEKGIRRGFI